MGAAEGDGFHDLSGDINKPAEPELLQRPAACPVHAAILGTCVVIFVVLLVYGAVT